ncbi:hypothetical protein HWV62_26925 [Athelia sp. TMB]|nr:hypothetical protein HWV62_26925 [Athelia sp. TMB]
MTSVFEPSSVIAILKQLLPLKEQKPFEKDWTAKVQKQVEQWEKSRTTQPERTEQLEWVAHIVEYVKYLKSATSVHGLAKDKTPRTLKATVPIMGPRFIPPTYLQRQQRNTTPVIEPETTYLKPLTVIHPIFFPSLAKCPQCDGDDIRWDEWTTTGPRDVHGVRREEMAIGVQLRCNGMCAQRFKGKDAPEQGVYCFATTNVLFWEKREHWEIPLARELYNLITELRPSTTSAGLQENIRSYRTRQAQPSLVASKLREFSGPWDPSGYNDTSITDDLISDVYLSFSDRTRTQESQTYLRTLTAQCVSMDNTFKLAAKATVVDANHSHSKLMSGGILSALNEFNEIIAWAEEVLKGIHLRLEILGLPAPEMIVVDNCCQVRARITRVLPDARVVLDMYHFMMRYLVVTIGGTKNPFRSEVAQDITNTILKTRAKKGASATYWGKEEQERRLIEAYDKWSKKGGVWSAAAAKINQGKLGRSALRNA